MIPDYNEQLKKAIKHFWKSRATQQRRQGASTGTKDQGFRSAVTGGKQLDGFIQLISRILTASGLDEHSIYTRETALPGYFRPSKQWDLVAVVGSELVASIEFKSQVGPSFGNNFNNRIEEAVGSAADFWTAYREGAFHPSGRPWLGWMMLLEDTGKSRSAVRVEEPHFKVFPEFDRASYARRYELFCQRLIRERLYDGACLILSPQVGGLKGEYTEPNEEITFTRFAASLAAHALTRGKTNGARKG